MRKKIIKSKKVKVGIPASNVVGLGLAKLPKKKRKANIPACGIKALKPGDEGTYFGGTLGNVFAHIVIPAHLPRKSNQRRIFKNKKTGAPIIVKSQEALEFESLAPKYVNALGGKLFRKPARLSMEAYITYRSSRSDLSVELLLDVLEKCCLYENDVQVVECRCFKMDPDPLHPKVNVIIREAVEPEVL